MLSPAERELVSGIFHPSDLSGLSAGDSSDDDEGTAFLQLAQLRLRNIVEKHSEALKRARLAARSGGSGRQIETIEGQLWICTEALAICKQRLQKRGLQE